MTPPGRSLLNIVVDDAEALDQQPAKGAVTMRVIPAAVTVGVVGVVTGGLLLLPGNDGQQLVVGTGPIKCDIVYADGSDYVDEMSRFALERTPLEIRKWRGEPGWVVVLLVKPVSVTQKDLRTGQTSVQLTRTGPGRAFADLPVVTDAPEIADAMYYCITGNGSPD